MAAEKGWTTEQQGLLLSSFYWGYIVTQIPGGILTAKYGARVYLFFIMSFFLSPSSFPSSSPSDFISFSSRKC